MAKGLVNESSLNSIAEAINVLNGTNGEYYPSEMALAILDAIPTETASGNPINIVDAAAYPAESVITTLEPVQDLHGYDRPWPAGGGKNLLPPATSSTSSGVTFTVNSDGSVTFNGTASGNAIFRLSQNTNLLKPNTTYVINGSDDASTIASYRLQININDQTSAFVFGGNDVTFTTPENITNLICYIVVLDGNTASNVTFKPMIRLASDTDPTYAPYSNICPITGHTGDVLTRTGSNLCHGVAIQGGISTYTGELDPTLTNRISLIDMNVTAGETYTFASNQYVRCIYGYDSNGDPVQKIVDTPEGSAKNTTFTVPQGCSKVGVSLMNSSSSSAATSIVPSDLQNAMLNSGSTALPYEPYQGSTHTATFPSTVYGGKVDVVNGKLTVDRAEVDLGTLTWVITSSGSVFAPFFQANIENLNVKYEGEYSGTVYHVLCSNYKVTRRSQNYFIDYTLCLDGATGTVKYLQIKDPRYDNAADFKTAMSGVQLVYELATPIEYDITPQEVQMLLGDNNIWCDTGNTTLKYKVDLSRFIAKLQAAQATPQLSLSRQAVSLDAPMDAEPMNETTQNEDEVGNSR